MAEPTDEPTNRELLERIKRLESENSELRRAIDKVWKNLDMRLKGDVVELRLKIIPLEDRIAELKEDFAVFKSETAGGLRHHEGLLGALIAQVFPKFHEVRDKVWAIIPPYIVDPRINKKLDERRR